MGQSNADASRCVTTQEIKERIEKKDIYIIDVRNPSELGEENCHTIKADKWINIPLPAFEKAMNLEAAEFKQTYGLEKPSKENSNIVINCGLGGRSDKALTKIHELGYTKARHYPGGYKKWKEEQ